jgi:hypothetical protein
MTTYGIEWDTDALINIKHQQLSDANIAEKIAALHGENFTITLESKYFEDYMLKKSKKTEEEIKSIIENTFCQFTLEAQIGVFKNPNDNAFGIESLHETLRNFTNVWNNIIENKQIILNEKPFSVLAFTYVGNIESYKLTHPGRKIYKDCSRTKQGLIYDTKYAYIDNLDDVLGKVQMTCGMKLKYISHLFKKIAILVHRCEKHETKCNTIPYAETNAYLLYTVRDAYLNTWDELIDENIFNKDGSIANSEDAESYNNLLSFYMIINYYMMIRREIIRRTNENNRLDAVKSKEPRLDVPEYGKGGFSIKMRTHFVCIFNMLSENCKTIFNKLISKYYHVEDYKLIRSLTGNDVELLEMYINPNNGNPFEIFQLDDNVVDRDIYTKINIPVINSTMFSMYDENKKLMYLKMKMVNDKLVSIMGRIEFGEWWTPAGSDIVHFELRTLDMITALLQGPPFPELPPGLIEANIKADKIEDFVKNIIDNFLNPSLSLDIKPYNY